MPTGSTRDLVIQLYRVINESLRTGDADHLDQVIAPDVVDHHTGVSETPGIQGVKETMAAFTAAFPDLRFHVVDIIAEGDRAAVRYTLTGTHRGELMGIPPLGKRIEIPGMDVFRFHDGKVVETWGEMDSLELMKQLDAIPASMLGTA